LCFLPEDDKNDMNTEVASEILDLLIKISENLFTYSDDKEECIQFRSKLEEYNSFNTLLLLLNIYDNILFKLRISIVLGNFYKYIVIPDEGKIIISILINYLKVQSTKKLNENENNKLMINVLNAFVNISLCDNEKVLLDGGIIPLLLPLVNSSDTNVWKKTVFLLSNICNIKSVEGKNSIINYGIFDVFYKKILEISPFPPQKMNSSDYFSISDIIDGINSLLFFNRFGATSFFKTPFIRFFLQVLNSTISFRNTSNNEYIKDIQLNICRCFSRCTIHCYEDALLLVEMKVIDSLLHIIEMYINEIKKKKILLNEETVEVISIIFFNMGVYGSTSGSKKEKNKFKNYFDENNRLSILVNLFGYLVSQEESPIQKNIINYISTMICLLLKNEIPPLYCVLEYVKKLKSSPSPASGYDFPLIAKDSWNEMVKADKCMCNNYQFEEIVVPEDFDVENGVLGLHQYIYLNVIQFLDSSVVRKV
jgi:hypothetical protein